LIIFAGGVFQKNPTMRGEKSLQNQVVFSRCTVTQETPGNYSPVIIRANGEQGSETEWFAVFQHIARISSPQVRRPITGRRTCVAAFT
jgi:hypothetical protein